MSANDLPYSNRNNLRTQQERTQALQGVMTGIVKSLGMKATHEVLYQPNSVHNSMAPDADKVFDFRPDPNCVYPVVISTPRKYHEMFRTWLLMQHTSQKIMAKRDWINRALPFWLAGAAETCESFGHLGWEWWKPRTPDTEQLALELIDIQHFAMCAFLVNVAATVYHHYSEHGDINEALALTNGAVSISEDPTKADFYVSYEEANTGSVEHCTFDFDVLAQQFSAHLFSQINEVSFKQAKGPVELLTLLNFSQTFYQSIPMNHWWQAIFAIFSPTGAVSEEEVLDKVNALYLKKNVLNMFRQCHGEKRPEIADIAYTRQWIIAPGIDTSEVHPGSPAVVQEDNEVLTAITKAMGQFDPEVVWTRLRRAYRQHVLFSNPQKPINLPDITLEGFLLSMQ